MIIIILQVKGISAVQPITQEGRQGRQGRTRRCSSCGAGGAGNSTRFETSWYRFKKRAKEHMGQGEPGLPEISRFTVIHMTKWHGEFCFTFKASFRGEARVFKKFLLKFDDLWKNTTHCWILWCILRTNGNNGTLSRHLITTCSRQKLTANAIV